MSVDFILISFPTEILFAIHLASNVSPLHLINNMLETILMQYLPSPPYVPGTRPPQTLPSPRYKGLDWIQGMPAGCGGNRWNQRTSKMVFKGIRQGQRDLIPNSREQNRNSKIRCPKRRKTFTKLYQILVFPQTILKDYSNYSLRIAGV